jgi:RNAse (barnase) inhibitor barstar
MSVLSNIAAQAVLPLGSYQLEDLHRCADQSNQVLLEADLSKSIDKAAVLDKIGKQFKLPKHYGKNLDALFDCLTELKANESSDHPGFLIVLKNIPDHKKFDPEAREALLDVFRDAGDHFFDQKIAFRVFYSVEH